MATANNLDDETRGLSLGVILVADAPLDGVAGGNTVDPGEEVGEGLELLLGEAAALPALDPGPGLNVRDAVLALAGAHEILARLPAPVYAAQLDLQNAEDTQRLVPETVDGVCALLPFLALTGPRIERKNHHLVWAKR